MQPLSSNDSGAGEATELAPGGFASGMEVLTVDGVIDVDSLAPGDLVYALEPTTRMVKYKPVTAIKRVNARSELVAVETQRTELHVAPDHRILYRTDADRLPRFKRAADLQDRTSIGSSTIGVRLPANASRRSISPTSSTITRFVRQVMGMATRSERHCRMDAPRSVGTATLATISTRPRLSSIRLPSKQSRMKSPSTRALATIDDRTSSMETISSGYLAGT